MGKLDLAVGYLSGAMEYVADHGVGWRRKFIGQLHEVLPNVDLIDPTNKPGGEEMKIGENKAHQNELKEAGRFFELKQYVNRYRRYDLRFVDISDFIVVAIDPNEVPQWGTANETFLAEMQHKPTFFLCDGGAYNFPNWLFDLLEFDDEMPNNIFDSTESLIAMLKALDSGEEELSKEWVLVRKWIELNRQCRLELVEMQSKHLKQTQV